MIYHPFRHLGLKAMSVALALLVWLSVSGEQTVERSLRIPLALQNIPPQLELVDIPPETVAVRVRGGSGFLSHLSSGDLMAIIDLSSARPGRRFVPLTLNQIEAPVGVEVTQVDPETISLEFQRSATRSVPVAANLDGQPAPGYAVASVTAQPSSVEVVGPEHVLRQLTRVITEPVSVAGATAPLRETATLGVPVPGLRLKQAGKAVVNVDIRPVAVTRTIDAVAVQPRGARRGADVRLTPAQVDITVKGPEAAFSGITAGRFAAFVDLAGLEPGRYNLPIQVEPPPNLEPVQIQPPTIAVRIK
ncbi:MAG: YbbR-like domain-containing protein [Bacteroidales bacterium]